MVDSPLGDLWLEKDTQKKVRTRLWRSWSIFEDNVRDMKAAMDQLMEKLGDMKAPRSDASSIVRELKRATFTLNRSAYADLLSTIRDGVSNLESLAATNIELEPERRLRSRIRLLSILRDISVSIYQAIRSSFTCACKHGIALRMSTCSADIIPGDAEADVIQHLKFHIALSYEPGSIDPSQLEPSTAKQLWDELTLELVAPPIQPATRPVLPEPLRPAKTTRIQRSVRFGSFQSSLSSSATITLNEANITSMTLGATSPTTTSVSDPAADLCEHLKGVRKRAQGESCGKVVDRSSAKARCFALYPSQIHGQGGDKMVSLHDVLTCQTNMQPLTYRDRLQLAVFTASSVLQLYQTPWLSELPSSHHFFLIARNGLESSCYKYAFVMPAGGSPSTIPLLPGIIRSPTLLALGILLIEIICGQTIDVLRTSGDGVHPASPDLLCDYIVARRLLTQVYQASSNYGSAVRRCINGEFPRQTLDLDDEDFRQEVYSGVVALLEEDLSHT
ncbi:hypothetical protein B0T25DRAFT_444075 [Lasiosphaeria hispida]|uniref:DUF7580 domain-containing protein n=1 Tax=Lasiosphaeria hispida TaxID=260671 RepID=A0AAJ0HXR1_9PEZI|nr:hypothetical protein B0T25DRAFT_444075 [Lasiosphaeria hispida]